jgi:pyruvate/2-oxoglutarate dehydrogenase complex dihydrolipoamide acyltransferase (E2) component
MDTTLNPAQTDTRNAVFARVDEELANVYEQLARADEQIAGMQEQLSRSEHGDARHPSDHPQTRVNTFRPAVPGKRASPGGRAVRGFTGLILTACIGVAAIVWQSPYGDAAKRIVARWAPQLVATSSLPLENPGFSAQPSPPAVQAAAAKTASPQPASSQPAPPAQTAAEDVAPTAAALSPEVTQLLQSMARDLATVGQGIEQLKASQEQMTRDNASIAEQLKASQEQMARLSAKVSEQNPRPRISAPPPRLAAAPARKPAPALPSRQDTARPQATTQQVQEPQMSSTPRSSMPAR